MSQHQVRRKSPQHQPQALAAAGGAVDASQKPAPHQVVLRIKRKRGDAAVEGFLVTTDEGNNNENDMPDRKRRVGPGSIEETLAVLNLNKAAEELQQQQQQTTQMTTRLFYKRERTTEPDGSDRKGVVGPPVEAVRATQGTTETVGKSGGRLDALLLSGVPAPLTTSPPPTVLDYLEVRRVKARGIGSTSDLGGLCGRPIASSANFHVIDLQPIARRDKNRDITFKSETSGKQRAAPVLTPVERQADEAIFTAFRTGDLSSLRSVLALSPTVVNYRRRLGDGTTALMAAAFHGDMDTVRYLLSLGAKASLVDAADKSAALFAGMRGHHECFAELQRVADEEVARSTLGQRGGGRDDFVYDFYYFQPSAPRSPADGGNVSGDQAGGTASLPADEHGDKMLAVADAPVVRLSGIGPVDENAIGTVGVELIFDHDSDWSELGDDAGEDADSNSEGYYGNDYPEDEGGDFGTGGPYVYGGSSCASEDGSSSDGRLGSDDDTDFRQLADTYRLGDGGRADVSSFYGDGASGRAQAMPTSEGADDAVDGSDHTDVENAHVFAWDPTR